MIQVSHLTKMYGPRTAVQDLSFQVGKGEIVGFLGPNGAGKSTTMKILTGFMPATDGKVSVAGADVFTDPIAVKKNIGYLPENPPVYLDMTVEDYLAFAARLKLVPRAQVRASVDQAVEKTNLGGVSKRLIGNLSKGYRQRVGLAQALVNNPPVLILDEPTVGLDPKQIIEIRELIKGLGGDHTVILSSHILPEVTATCQRIIVINQGRIAAEDTIEGLTLKMKKGMVFRLQVRNPSVEGIRQLMQVPGVANITGTAKDYVVEVSSESEDTREGITAAVVKSGMGLMEFAGEKLSLEDIFLQLTTEEAGASAENEERSE